MPITENGDVVTTQPEKIETLHDRIMAGSDVIPLKVGGMAYIPQDTGKGVAIPATDITETTPGG